MGAQYNTAVSRLLNQFGSSTNLLKVLESFFTKIEESQTLVEYLRDFLNLNTAEGVWLDVIGVILGLERPYKEQDPDTIFTTKGLGEPDIVTRGTKDSLTGVGGYLQSAEGITNISDPTARETDANYRKLLRAKTFANNQIGTFADIYTYLKDGFDVRSTMTSTQTGLVLITLYDFLSQRERNHVKQFAPLLAGIAIEFTNWPPAP
jgi:hypothetical protein